MANIKTDSFSRGYMCAVANLARMEGTLECTEVKELFGCNPMTVMEMRKAGVDDSDLEILRPLAKKHEKFIKQLKSQFKH